MHVMTYQMTMKYAIFNENIQLTVMLNVAPIANPIPSATNDTIRPTTANKPNRKFSAGKPLIQYDSAKKIKLNKICVNKKKIKNNILYVQTQMLIGLLLLLLTENL